MGYAYYEINGKPCGYSVEATCEEPGCKAEFDRGLAYLCGQRPGGDEQGCGGYFCYAHLNVRQECHRCAKRNACNVCDGEGIALVNDEPYDCKCMQQPGGEW